MPALVKNRPTRIKFSTALPSVHKKKVYSTFNHNMLLTSAHTSCHITGLKLGYRVGVGGRLLFGSPSSMKYIQKQNIDWILCLYIVFLPHYESVCVCACFLSLSQAQYVSNLKAN